MTVSETFWKNRQTEYLAKITTVVAMNMRTEICAIYAESDNPRLRLSEKSVEVVVSLKRHANVTGSQPVNDLCCGTLQANHVSDATVMLSAIDAGDPKAAGQLL